jgi:hypothetical protein
LLQGDYNIKVKMEQIDKFEKFISTCKNLPVREDCSGLILRTSKS